MLPRYVFLLLSLALPFGTADAQITLTAADYPIRPGTNTYHSLDTANEDGSNTVAIEAIIALSGPNQTYDFTPITYETLFDGTIEVEAGATGPGAGIDPLDEATHTATYPFAFDDGETSIEGILYFYFALTNEAASTLGTLFQGESGGDQIEFTTTYTPDGRREAVFPMTFGTTWTSVYTQTVDFGGFEFAAEGMDTYEVDGWGTLIAPGVEGGVPVLRVKVTSKLTTNGFTNTSICYEMRSNAPVVAVVCEGDSQTQQPPTATVTSTGATATASEGETKPTRAALEAAYPNPARDAVTLEFDVPQGGAVELTVYDVLGRPVHRVVEGTRAAGRHTETLDVAGLAPGIYLARLTVDGQHWTRRLTVAR